tara:strand:- start:2144 stop:3250 length:1107 start_codon:yes stop_codon:yes gene_type:complete
MAKTVLCVLGTRPEAIKMAPVILALRAAGIRHTVLGTGQHREMLGQALGLFDIQMDHNLDLMQPNQTLASLTSRCLTGIDEVIRSLDPACIVGQGDTTTVFCASLAAFYQRIPFAHVEAGLRSHDLQSPFPEEWNRIAAGRLATLHFAPTDTAREALLREHVPDDDILVTGNTVIDALSSIRDRVTPFRFEGFDRYALITLHRRENFGEPVRAIAGVIRNLAERHPDFGFVWPVHPNPNVDGIVREQLSGLPNVRLTKPLDYAEFLSVFMGCEFALSDSGGVQEEAPTLRKPVLVLREETERPEGVVAGVCRLVGSDPTLILDWTERLISSEEERSAMRRDISPYGDGCSSQRIVASLAQRFLTPNLS